MVAVKLMTGRLETGKLTEASVFVIARPAIAGGSCPCWASLCEQSFLDFTIMVVDDETALRTVRRPPQRALATRAERLPQPRGRARSVVRSKGSGSLRKIRVQRFGTRDAREEAG